jgi:thiol-disulfide isomerase/thioredoxin
MLIQNVISYEDFSNYMKNYKYVIVNISASWCKPCVAIKPRIEKFVSVIEESDYIYLKIDNSVYEEDPNFDSFFGLKKIPYFAFIKDNSMVDSFVNGDFDFVSKKIILFIKSEREFDKTSYSQFDKNYDF